MLHTLARHHERAMLHTVARHHERAMSPWESPQKNCAWPHKHLSEKKSQCIYLFLSCSSAHSLSSSSLAPMASNS